MSSSPTRKTLGKPMAFEDVTTYASHYAPDPTTTSTAYHGSQGQIDFDHLPTISLDKQGFEDIQLSAPARNITTTTTSSRPTLSTRLLSSLANTQPAAAALSRSGSVIHSRAKSLAALVPKLSLPKDNVDSPTERSQRTVYYQAPNRIFGDLFNGESAPIRLGVQVSPVKEEEDDDDDVESVMEYRSGFTERPMRPRARRTQTEQSNTSTSTRTSWFGRKSNAQVSVTPPADPKPTDELLKLDINSALFPHGAADAFSPQDFNDLILNATNLLQRLQSAYKEKVEYIASIQPELDAQREEVEETETRAQHLKMQLEDLSRQAQEQLQINRDLTEELAQEKSRNRTVRLVRPDSQASTHSKGISHGSEAGDGIDDDDDNTPRRRKRASAASASDSGFESDADSASVFSAGIDTPPLHQPQSYHYQKRLPRTPEDEESDWAVPKSSALPGDRHGSSLLSWRSRNRSPLSSVVGVDSMGSAGEPNWSAVQKLKGENHALRVQVEDMQRTLQGCIDFVSTVGNP